VFHAGIGPVNKSDIFMAESGSRLIIGYDVGVEQKIEPMLSEHGVDVRLYDVIYLLTDDVRDIAASLIKNEDEEEKIKGKARVIALFKSSRKGIILGCQVEKGRLAHGDFFRVIKAMGPVYSGKIESLHIEKNAVQVAKQGQQVGLKITDFKKVSIGDFVESYSPVSKKERFWSPKGILIRRLKGK
jgi:translation initiation factor IF-2